MTTPTDGPARDRPEPESPPEPIATPDLAGTGGACARARDLSGRLRAYVPHDRNEAAHLREVRDLLATAPDPFTAGAFDPGHVTASAFVLDRHRSSVLLIHHAKLDRWLQPGGHVEPGDRDVEAAARREVREETGLGSLVGVDAGGAPFDLDVHVIPARGALPEHRHFDVRFLFAAREGDPSPASDARDVRWVGLDDLARVGGDHGFRRAAHKLGSRVRP